MIQWIKNLFINEEHTAETEDLKNQQDLVLGRIENRTMTLQLVLEDLCDEDTEIFKEIENEEIS